MIESAIYKYKNEHLIKLKMDSAADEEKMDSDQGGELNNSFTVVASDRWLQL